MQDKSFAVEVPPGVDEGSTLRLTARGASGGAGGQSGDLYVHLGNSVRPICLDLRQEVRVDVAVQRARIRAGVADRGHHHDQTECLGLLPEEGGEKSAPKKIPETDAIFDYVRQINHAADTTDGILRVSMDAKATIKVGPFARGGKARAYTAAADHDFQPLATVTPVGIFLPTLEELFV